MFAGGLDFSLPVRKFFYDPLGSGRAFVQCVVSLTGFALVGGPARQDAPKAVTALKKLNVPYLVSLPLVFQTTEEWLESELGVHPVQVALQVASRAATKCGTLGRVGLLLHWLQVGARWNAPCLHKVDCTYLCALPFLAVQCLFCACSVLLMAFKVLESIAVGFVCHSSDVRALQGGSPGAGRCPGAHCVCWP